MDFQQDVDQIDQIDIYFPGLILYSSYSCRQFEVQFSPLLLSLMEHSPHLPSAMISYTIIRYSAMRPPRHVQVSQPRGPGPRVSRLHTELSRQHSPPARHVSGLHGDRSSP